MRRIGLPAAVLGLALGATQVAAAVPSQASSATRIAVEAAPALPHGAKSAAAPAAATKLSLDVQLKTGHEAQLEAYASAVADKSSLYYHQYLTPGQIAQDFGASADEVTAVTEQLRAEGLTVGQVASDGMFLPVSGTVAQSEHAFGVTIAGYQAAGRKFYANTTSPTVSAAISGDVSRIVGLDDISYAVPHYTATTHKLAAAPVGKAVTAKATSNSSVGTCSAINTYWNSYNTEYGTDLQEGSGYYTADEVASAYGVNSAIAAGDDGSGVTVAVFELESYDPAGVAAIDSCYGHSNSVTEVKVDGGPTAPPNQVTQVGIESALDIENIANLAPGASIIDYAGPDAANASETDLLNIFETIFNQDKANVVSSSWGLCEPLTQGNSTAVQGEENALFEQAAAQGQTVVAASGDSGSTDCYGDSTSAAVNSGLSVDDPASQPFVLGAGGTNMTGTGTFTQSVWNECFDTTDPTTCGSGGGGVSNYWPAQSYESGLSPSGYTTHCAKASTTGCRGVPDVSALADPNDGYVIEETVSGTGITTGEYYNIIGGTSGAAPVWAAIFALADSSTQCKSNGGAGFVNSNLYTAGKAGTSGIFTDVTVGNNDVTEFGSNGGYAATAGYDLASGWGTPDATGVISTVCAGSVTSPSSYYVPNGPVRLLDTRKGIGGTTGPVKAHASVNLQITGVQGVPTSGVTAVVLNVTAVSPSANGVATVYPYGQSVPTSSNLNWLSGQTKPNLVVVPVGTGGKVSLWNGSNGTVQFLADEAGYFTSSSSATGVSTYTAVGPVRAMDTRHGTGVPLAKIGADSGVSLQVGGSTVGSVSIPSGVTAVAMNVTAVNSTTNSDLIVYPNETSAGTAESVPSVSNLNFTAGQTAANMVIVPVGPDGKVDFFNGASSGSLDAIADIAGYFTPGTSGAKYHAVGPVRLLDTRSGQGESLAEFAASGNPIGEQGYLTLPLPASYSALVANLTVVSPAGNGFLSAYASNGSLPNVSNLNFLTGQTIPNLAIVPSSTGVKFYNASTTGSTQLIVDMAGFFSAN
ncbi:S8/S53 family peptidase [Actinospica durhamensis]|uniref:S8/S53 family peptidase n=1 Tax=Actinospica durhamensis TaxID=1508375 RepID=A0A941EW12_9ACTN|nr:S53 family peptidase [Actinospica durhamensis]MBR7834964.1 S8/S53 family peptidase [Actinospica durhamensis]